MKLSGVYIAMFVATLFASQLVAQSSLQYPWYVNVNGGVSQLYGDIQNEENPLTKIKDESGLGLGLRAGRSITPYLFGHLQFSSIGLRGSKTSIEQEFDSRISEIQLGATLSLTNLILGEKERLVNVYGLAGIGAMFINGEINHLTPEGVVQNTSETSGAFGLAFPLAVGVDVKISDRMFINLEPGLRFTNSDMPDTYERGGRNDAYFYTSVGISYAFDIWKKTRKKKPVIVPPDLTTENDNTDVKVNLVYDYPEELKSTDEFTLTSTIHKGDIGGRAELTQVLPIGFNIIDTAIDNARMEFRNYTLNLYWDELPKDSVFDISYRVKLDKIYGRLPMTSILYLESTNQEYRFKTDVFIRRKIVAGPIAVKEEKPKEEEMVSPSEKVDFSIQLRASWRKQLSVDSLTQYLAVDKKITEEKVGNWYKYSIGTFKTYQEARNYRNDLTQKKKLRGAFIIAYYEGERLNNLSELQDLAPDALPGSSTTRYKEQGTCYRIQILALQHSRVAPSVLKDMYSLEAEVNEEVFHNWRKYTVGECLTKKEALSLRLKLISKGLTGAFLVKYSEGERAGL